MFFCCSFVFDCFWARKLERIKKLLIVACFTMILTHVFRFFYFFQFPEAFPLTHRLAGKHPTAQVYADAFLFSDQQASRHQATTLRATTSHSQTSRQAPNSTIYPLSQFTFRPASKQPGAGKAESHPLTFTD